MVKLAKGDETTSASVRVRVEVDRVFTNPGDYVVQVLRFLADENGEPTGEPTVFVANATATPRIYEYEDTSIVAGEKYVFNCRVIHGSTTGPDGTEWNVSKAAQAFNARLAWFSDPYDQNSAPAEGSQGTNAGNPALNSVPVHFGLTGTEEVPGTLVFDVQWTVTDPFWRSQFLNESKYDYEPQLTMGVDGRSGSIVPWPQQHTDRVGQQPQNYVIIKAYSVVNGEYTQIPGMLYWSRSGGSYAGYAWMETEEVGPAGDIQVQIIATDYSGPFPNGPSYPPSVPPGGFQMEVSVVNNSGQVRIVDLMGMRRDGAMFDSDSDISPNDYAVSSSGGSIPATLFYSGSPNTVFNDTPTNGDDAYYYATELIDIGDRAVLRLKLPDGASINILEAVERLSTQFTGVLRWEYIVRDELLRALQNGNIENSVIGLKPLVWNNKFDLLSDRARNPYTGVRNAKWYVEDGAGNPAVKGADANYYQIYRLPYGQAVINNPAPGYDSSQFFWWLALNTDTLEKQGALRWESDGFTGEVNIDVSLGPWQSTDPPGLTAILYKNSTAIGSISHGAGTLSLSNVSIQPGDSIRLVVSHMGYVYPSSPNITITQVGIGGT